MQEQVYEYFNEYFNGTLNESTSDEDIMDAVYDLVYLTEAVCEEVGIGKKMTNLRDVMKTGFRQGRDRAIARKRKKAFLKNMKSQPRIGKMWGF